jgi:peptidoglycan/LPS O-acetylase OafA/YrhL
MNAPLATVSPAMAMEPVADFVPRLPSRIPSLDGLRALSIVMVMLAHTAGTPGSPAWLLKLEHAGNLGVKVFFVISGFLITTLLYKELAATERISLRNFYLRRGFRIFPAFYTYFAVIQVATYLGIIRLQPGDALHAATFTMNYHLDRFWYYNHIWSLSVEEQFYLLWPSLVLLLGARKSLMLAAATLVLSPTARAWQIADMLWHGTFSIRNTAILGRQFECIADALATGCLLAGLYNALGRSPRYLAFLRGGWFVLVPVVGIGGSCGLYLIHPLLYFLIGQTITHVAIALCLDHCVRFSGDAIGHLLNWRPVAFVGVLSYSLYLWQQPFLNVFETVQQAWTCFPLNLVLAVGTALLSYYLVERPFLRWRARFRASTRVPIPRSE